jgi:sarcosine oxidase subunit beta
VTHTCDAVIVGAGLNGAATAFFLARRGFGRIIVVDADIIGAGASGAAVGLLRSHYDNRPETELAARSLPYFRDWAELVGGDCGWLPTGFFRFVEREEIPSMQANVAVQREFGETVEILNPADARRIVPAFNVDGVGAVVYEPASGTADNHQATVSMLRVACSRGVEFWPFTRAHAVETTAGRVAGLATSRGPVVAPVVVLAAGLGCKPLALSCGIALPLVEKTIRVAEILPPESVRLSVSYMDPISDSWITPRRQRRAIIAVPPPPAASGPPDPSFSRSEAASGLPAVARRLPGIENATIVGWWSRADCFAPDGKPVIGPVEGVDGLYVNTAGAGKGHKVAPAAGLALSELIADGKATSIDIAPFGSARLEQAPRAWSASEYRKRVIG